MSIRYLAGLLGLVSLFACGSEEEQITIDQGREYFPLVIGQKRTYQLDSIVFDLENAQQLRDTSRYLVEESITDTFMNAAGIAQYRIERKLKPWNAPDWTEIRIWSASLTDREAIRQEENLSFVKLAFPLRKGMSWDGNKYIPDDLQVPVNEELLEVYKYWQYRLGSLGEPLQLGDLHLDEVLTVRQADEDNIIERRYALEQYARGVGLVYQRHIILDSQCGGNPADCIDLDWVDKAERGYMLELTLLSYQ